MERDERDLSLESIWDEPSWETAEKLDFLEFNKADLAILKALSKLDAGREIVPDPAGTWNIFTAQPEVARLLKQHSARPQVFPSTAKPPVVHLTLDEVKADFADRQRGRSWFGRLSFAAVIAVIIGLLVFLWFQNERGTQLAVTPTPSPGPDSRSTWVIQRGSTNRTGVYSGPGSREALELYSSTLFGVGTGGGGQSNPIVRYGLIYQSSGPQVTAVDELTGAEVWSHKAGGVGSMALGTIDLYVPDSAGYILVLNPLTGVEKRRIDIAPNPYAGIALVKNVLYIPTVDRAVVAYDLDTSKVIWKFQIADGKAHGDKFLYAGQIAYSNNVVFATSGETGVFALDSETGKLKWSYDIPWAQIETPAIDDGRVFVTGKSREAPFGGSIYAFDESTGSLKWIFPATDDNIASTGVAVKDGVVYAGGSDNSVRALDAVTGREIWSFRTGGAVSQPPTITNDVLYVTASDRTFYALRLSDGQELWRTSIPSAFMDGPVPAGRFVYGTTGDGYLVVLGPKRSATPDPG